MPQPDPYRVLLVDPIAPTALDALRARYDVTVRLRPAPADLPGLLHGQDAIVLRSGITLPGPVIASANQLRVIARAGNGIDNIDLPAARQAGIQVFNVPSVSSRAVAELAIGLLFAAARHVAAADRQVRAGVWNKAALAGTELTGKSIGIIGVGDIGGHVASLATGIGMNVLGSVASPTLERREEWAARGVQLTTTADLLVSADMVVVTCPLTDRTRSLLDARALATMKPHAYLVNVARAEIVDGHALYAALDERRIAGAALDVHTAETGTPALAGLDNVVLTPHIGAMTDDAQDRIGRALVEDLERALAGRDATTRIC
ncbi:NAD(P)-dependent oxidoreductase [Streptomyces sp. BE147]|uniref:NAD(P)-dependent oxidoreductase n=1 Tax=Streptomyces sp. BE147 TaxID=3002524 RepID=UPI002E77A47D|nr:NAD(P)-dependent oxidoreductase [Streptomyces sp. BE147]MEE1737000.1 NAD(P)-dependent oxidoreductase [Streptomyces sp. BE147]